MLLSNLEIRSSAKDGMITPFSERVKEFEGKKVISYGLGYFGYDVRLSNRIRHSPRHLIIDPKNISVDDFEECTDNVFVVKPNDFILGLSYEYFKIPLDVLGICLGKSTYARCGIDVNITPLEPGWEGYIVMEIANLSSSPVKIYANEGIAQIIFFEGKAPDTVYKGYYQKQVDFKVGI